MCCDKRLWMLSKKIGTWKAITTRFDDLTTQRHCFEGDKAQNDVLILTMESIAIISFFFPLKSKLTSGWPKNFREIWPFFAKEKNTTLDWNPPKSFHFFLILVFSFSFEQNIADNGFFFFFFFISDFCWHILMVMNL